MKILIIGRTGFWRANLNTRIMNQFSHTVANERFRGLGFEFQGSLKQGSADTFGLLKAVCKT